MDWNLLARTAAKACFIDSFKIKVFSRENVLKLLLLFEQKPLNQ